MRAASRILVLLFASVALAPTAVSAAPRASLPDIEDEVMCPICGTLLELSEAPQADRERVFIRDLIAQGKSKDQIKDALVAEYGEQVLATPEGSGFDLSAYVIPIVAFLLAAVALVLAVRRWRSSRARGEPDQVAPKGADADRLESDLARYDL